jgi:mediator of RNA polymerase II transcription subunit 12
VIVTEQFGLIPDGKGVKVRGFNCDKKQGLQVSEKQLISPWDLLEGHKNPAPLSFHWFQAGLEKTRVKKKTAQWFLFCFFGFFLYILSLTSFSYYMHQLLIEYRYHIDFISF